MTERKVDYDIKVSLGFIDILEDKKFEELSVEDQQKIFKIATDFHLVISEALKPKSLRQEVKLQKFLEKVKQKVDEFSENAIEFMHGI